MPIELPVIAIGIANGGRAASTSRFKTMRYSPALSRLTLAIFAAMAAQGDAHAATRNWIGTNGLLWSNTLAWQGGVVPVNGDEAVLGTLFPGASNATANFTSIYTGAGLNLLKIDATAVNTFTISQSGSSSAMIAVSEIIGDTVDGGVYSQTAGSNTAGTITLGNQIGGGGVYNLSGTGTVNVFNVLVGSAGAGTFNQSSGTVNLLGFMFVSQSNTVSTSNYNLSGGTLAVADGAFIGVGASRGNFTQTGGTVSFAGSSGFIVQNGTVSGFNNTYALSGSGQIVNASFQEIGNGGVGVATFTQTGGSNAVSASGYLSVGNFGNGAYNLGGGTLSSPLTQVGAYGGGIGTFTHTAGSFSNAAGQLKVGDSAGANGTYILSGTGSISLASETVGNSGTGTFTQSAGTNAAISLTIGQNSGAAGTYNMSGGNLNLGAGASSGTLTVGLSSTNAQMVQTGGAVAVAGFGGNVAVGLLAGSNGTYSLSGGTLSADVEVVGVSGTGTFSQSAGTNAATFLTIGKNSGAAGTYNMSGGNLNLDPGAFAGVLFVGLDGTGQMNQTGGAVAAAGAGGGLYVGYNAGSAGTYLLKGGTLSPYQQYVGLFGTGTFTQSGGSNTVTNLGGYGALTVGYAGQGTYTLNSATSPNGSLSARAEVIGLGALGTFNQSGSTTHTVASTLDLGGGMGGVGVYNQSSGTLNAQILNVGVVAGSSGTFNQSNVGSTTVAQLSIGSASSAANYNLSGGSLSATAATINEGGSFSQSGGSFSGTLTNNGTLAYSAGSFLGSLVNGSAGALNLTGVLVAGGTVTNQGTVTLASGKGLGGSWLDNQNTITLAGGTLAGGTINNNGAITGYGSFSGGSALQNYGQLTQGTGNLLFSNTGANANYGTVTLASGRQMQMSSGASFSNAGSLVLNGALVTGAGSLTNAIGGTLAGPGTVSAAGFANHGNIVPGAGTLNIQASWTSDGVVQLGSVLSTLTGGAITNQGVIQGLGTVATAITNTGTIEAIAGTLTLSAAGVTNNAGGTMAASTGGQLLLKQGAINAGTIALSGGTVDSSVFSLPNSGQITGFGLLRTGGLNNTGKLLLAGGSSNVYGSVTGQTGSLVAVSGNSSATFYGNLDIKSGAELRVTAGSVATFFGSVAQRSGSTFSGVGTKFYEGGLSVGGSPGLGTDGGDVNFGSGNLYLAEIGGTTACTAECASNDALKNLSFDKYVVAGHLGLGGTLKIVSWNGFVGQAGQSFDLLDWGSVSGGFSGIDASGLQLAPGTGLDLSQLDSTGTFSVVAVPEPETWALMLAGLCLAGARASRRGLAR